jgi:hypothetical protein
MVSGHAVQPLHPRHEASARLSCRAHEQAPNGCTYTASKSCLRSVPRCVKLASCTYAAQLRSYLCTPLFPLKSAPSSVHPEHRKLDQHHRPTRQREVRQLARLQPALHQRERQDVVHHAHPELRVHHERREPEHDAESAGTRVCSAARARQPLRPCYGRGRRARRRTWWRREAVVRGEEREAGEGGALGERADEDEGEGDEKVLVHEEERVNPCELGMSRWGGEKIRRGRTESAALRTLQSP